MRIKKLKGRRDCFRIISNERYVIATGTSVTVYNKQDLSVRCTIPAKVFPCPNCIAFLSEHRIIIKNNYGKYMIYNLQRKEKEWVFFLRNFDGTDVEPVVSTDGKIVYDIVSESYEPFGQMGLLIYPEEQRYEMLQFPNIEPPQKGWKQYSSKLMAKDNGEGMYYTMMFGPAENASEKMQRGFLLLHKEHIAGTNHAIMKRWNCMDPIPSNTSIYGKTCNSVAYLDEQYVIFQNLDYCDYQTQKEGSLCATLGKDKFSFIAKKHISNEAGDVLVLHKFYGFGQSGLILATLPQGAVLGTIDCVWGTDDRAICDIEFLDASNRFLIGSMNGIYLCER